MNKILQEVKQNKWVYIGFVVVVFLSAVLRLWGLGNNPFVADEFLDVNATQGYHQTGQWQAWDYNKNDVSVRNNPDSDKRAWIYRWQVAQVLEYLEPTEFNFRLVSALWGILTTIILFFVTFSFTKNRWIALLTAFFWAVSIPAIEINRTIRMYSMFAPIFLLLSWSLFQFIDSMGRCSCTSGTCPGKMVWKGILRLKWIYLIPTIIFGALSFHLHPLTGNIILILFVYFVVMFAIKRKELVARRYGAYILLMLLGGLLAKLFVPQAWEQFTSSLVFFDDHWSYVGHIMRNYWSPLLAGVAIIVGAWFVTAKQEDERPGIWIVSTFFTILLGAIFLWNRNVGPQYIFFVQTFGFMLTGAGVYAFATYLQKNIGSRGVFMVAIIAGFIFLPSYYYFFQENNTYHLTSKADTANYRKVFLFIKKNINDGDAMITRNFRNYYYSGLNVPVLDFGTERSEEQIKGEGKVKKITVAEVEKFGAQHKTIWIVYSDNDEKFITKEARAYFEQNCQKQNDLLVRGKVSVYKCESLNE
jgi:ABC-type multidrug transport system fused ATPase/permease subunit